MNPSHARTNTQALARTHEHTSTRTHAQTHKHKLAHGKHTRALKDVCTHSRKHARTHPLRKQHTHHSSKRAQAPTLRAYRTHTYILSHKQPCTLIDAHTHHANTYAHIHHSNTHARLVTLTINRMHTHRLIFHVRNYIFL